MPLKKLDEVNIGDRLLEDLTNSHGGVLIKAGTGIKENHLRLLQMWGVETINIGEDGGDGENDGSVQVTEKLLDQAETAITERFGGAPNNEVAAEILRVAAKLYAERLARRRVG